MKEKKADRRYQSHSAAFSWRFLCVVQGALQHSKQQRQGGKPSVLCHHHTTHPPSIQREHRPPTQPTSTRPVDSLPKQLRLVSVFPCPLFSHGWLRPTSFFAFTAHGSGHVGAGSKKAPAFYPLARLCRCSAGRLAGPLFFCSARAGLGFAARFLAYAVLSSP